MSEKIKNGIFAAKVSEFLGKNSKPNKHGVNPVFLEVFAGKSIKNRVLDGSSAENILKVEIGKSYLFNFQFTGVDPQYGDQYDFSATHEITTLQEKLEVIGALGAPEIL